jgi:hypothetical protein
MNRRSVRALLDLRVRLRSSEGKERSKMRKLLRSEWARKTTLIFKSELKLI